MHTCTLMLAQKRKVTKHGINLTSHKTDNDRERGIVGQQQGCANPNYCYCSESAEFEFDALQEPRLATQSSANAPTAMLRSQHGLHYNLHGNFACWSLLRVRAHLSPCPRVSRSILNGVAQSCVSSIAGASPHYPILADQVQPEPVLV